MKHILQKDIKDCGVAVSLMILEHDHQITENYYEFKSKIELSDNGLCLDKMIDLLGLYGDYKAYKCAFEELPSHPFITIIKLMEKCHYIMVWKKDKKYIYYSNPVEPTPNKMSLRKFKEIYNNIIIYEKEEILNNINFNKKIKKNTRYVIPLILLNIIEILVFSFSLLYLYNINEFDILKVGYFFTLLTVQIIIYLLKNSLINQINNLIDHNFNCINLNNEELKDHFKNIYYIKYKKNFLYNRIIPYLIIFIIGIFVFFYLHYIFALSMFILLSIFYRIEAKYLKKKEVETTRCQVLENEFDTSMNNMKEKLNELEIQIKKLSKLNINENIISIFYRQAMLIYIMLFFSLINQEKFVFIGIYLCFYLLDGLTNMAQYRADKEKYKYIIYKCRENLEK